MMERTSRGWGRVWTNLNESHEMRKNGEKFSWHLQLFKIPRDDEIPRDFSPINANAVYISNIGMGFNIFGKSNWQRRKTMLQVSILLIYMKSGMGKFLFCTFLIAIISFNLNIAVFYMQKFYNSIST